MNCWAMSGLLQPLSFISSPLPVGSGSSSRIGSDWLGPERRSSGVRRSCGSPQCWWPGGRVSFALPSNPSPLSCLRQQPRPPTATLLVLLLLCPLSSFLLPFLALPRQALLASPLDTFASWQSARFGLINLVWTRHMNKSLPPLFSNSA